MASFSDASGFAEWLKDKPREWWLPLVARHSLRFIPAIENLVENDEIPDASRSKIVLPIFRATLLLWSTASFPHVAKQSPFGEVASVTIQDAVNASADAFLKNAVDATVVAEGAMATLNPSEESALHRLEMSAHFAFNISPSLHAGLLADCNLLESGRATTELMSKPLWLSPSDSFGPNTAATPKVFWNSWDKLQTALIKANENWEVWLVWYGRVLMGAPVDQVDPYLTVLFELRIWRSGPEAVNTELLELLGRIGPSGIEDQSRWDFFVSYSEKDEAIAREVVAAVESAGKSAFAMYKDMLPGNNFVREMQAGLDGSGRVIAIYSPDYQASGHCQAEWAAAYAADPSGNARKLIPLLARPTSLNKLARQIVFASLVGKNADERRATILNAIADKPPNRSRDELKEVLAQVASPEPVLNQQEQLDAGPNRKFDKPFVDGDLVNLPSMQRGLAQLIDKSLPTNAPPVVGNVLKDYADHLLKRGAQPVVQYLDQLFAAIDAEFRAAHPEDWGKGLESLMESFSANHQLLRTHFPLESEGLFSETDVDEDMATGESFVRPLDEVSNAISDAVDANIATESLGHIAKKTAELGRDVASIPPASSAAGEGPRISVKKRYVLGTLGFYLALYNLIGSTASIVSTTTGQALFEALRKAVEMLMRLVF